ncbi:hypothetical protein IP92_04904 [Pseudoduganella flava]|uniref:Uncharacterized protein n=1 Tax=Pseudoduganella flava TaxID=871742 RepID=A0A562PHE7_9BURK|nr:hypothetical protein [Pseudoduganella flava]QGZ42683.1 hypothetical protein GO485_29060 [Pseudoduganella flava]TWI43849.1 hypothetical protein IP92_04904 [Pseudoduganella flava]
MTRYAFDYVGVKGVKKYRDAAGKTRQETRHFRQTLNPFNTNADGSLKTRQQILAEETIKRDAWLAE